MNIGQIFAMAEALGWDPDVHRFVVLHHRGTDDDGGLAYKAGLLPTQKASGFVVSGDFRPTVDDAIASLAYAVREQAVAAVHAYDNKIAILRALLVVASLPPL